jgi:uncharacterized protein (DUF1501 family)
MNKSSMLASRRLFLQRATALSTMGAAAPLALNLSAMGTATAQTAGDYKAIVCLFLFGGNDSMNMVLPTDTASWANYTAIRNQAPDPIALLAAGTAANAGAAVGTPARLGGVLPITPTNAQGRSFALHPLMGSLQSLFNTDKRLAIVPNVGPLRAPTTKAQYAATSHPKPAKLFSHNDQQNTWQSFATEGATKGWGGRLSDILGTLNTRATFTSISASGNAVWLSGETTRQYQVGSGGAIRMGANTAGTVYGSAAVAASMQRIVRASRGGHVLEDDLASVASRSIDAEVTLSQALKPASDALFGTAPATGAYNAATDPKLMYANPLTGAMTANGLAQQLQVVARMVDAGASSLIGARRQVFFVSLGGFDTHDLQNRNHAVLMAQVAQALSYFDSALGAMGKRDQVTTFTASDFGRTFTSNGDGTDHGWGAHHWVMGGAVRGGDLYGNFPVLGSKNANNNNFDSSPNQLNNGSLLPETSVDQLGATLARWFGASDAQCLDLFPNLNQFNASARNLGFMVG